MNSQQLQTGNKSIRSKKGSSGGWLGAGLGLVAVAAIAFAVYAVARQAAPPAASNPANSAAVAQSARDAAQQDVLDYVRAHRFDQAAPDANTQAVLSYLRTHGAGLYVQGQGVPDLGNMPSAHDDPSYHSPQRSSSLPAQSVPDANVQSVLDYLQAHGVQVDTAPDVARREARDAARAILGQDVPDATVQSVMDYLRAHGARLAVKAQSVPDAATQGVLDYLRVHGANVP